MRIFIRNQFYTSFSPPSTYFSRDYVLILTLVWYTQKITQMVHGSDFHQPLEKLFVSKIKNFDVTNLMYNSTRNPMVFSDLSWKHNSLSYQ